MTQEFVTLPREVVEQALDALWTSATPKAEEAIAALRAALDQTQEPPYGECDECGTEYSFDPTDGGSICVACLKERLKQPQCEQEPVAWALSHSKGLEFSSAYPMQKSKQAAEQMARQHMGAVTVSPLYTKPQPKRTPLTDEAVLGVAKSIEIQFDSERLNEQIDDILAFARAIEAAHNIK